MTPGQSSAVQSQENYHIDETAEKNSISVADASKNTILPALREYPSRLFVETTTRCNLRCAMCVKQTGGSGIVDGDISPAVFDALEPALPFAEALILNGIGEPLLHPELESFIRKGKSLMPDGSWVGFQTNGLLVDQDRALSLVRAGLDRICLSMDSVCPDTFREIREGGDVRDMENALSALRDAKKLQHSNLHVGMEFVLMRDNARELPAALRWAAAKGVSFAIVTHLLSYDGDHVGKAAYDTNTDEAVAFFMPWRQRAEKEGINLETYFKVRWNYLRSPEEQRVVDFVSEMQADARSREIFFHLKNLLARDEQWIGELEDIFEEAKRVSEETGLELTLPEIIPTSDRKCDFVDKGGAFISWDGEVHNCYFLWHRFNCYFPGRKKYITPKSFGNLSRMSMRDIWNDPDFISYRREVLRHDYPVCSNCNLVACEYIYSEKFEQDCFTNTVPCGDCFWCMGLFRCLQ
jgi:putative metalloenzyme radical SAM/SPASM domain maturase